MRSLEEIKGYLKTVGMCAGDIPKLLVEKGIIVSDNYVKITDKTWGDFVRWYDNVEEKEEEDEKQHCDVPLDEFESHLTGLWITLHDIATEAIECPIDDELQVRSCVKAKSIVAALFDAYRDTTVAFDVEEE
jgi:hypothetical protein